MVPVTTWRAVSERRSRRALGDYADEGTGLRWVLSLINS